MLVDHEKVVLALKAYVAGKNSHGQRDLLAAIARLEAEHQLEEGLPEKALRLYGVVISTALIRPALTDSRVGPADGTHDQSSHGGDGTEGEHDGAGHAGHDRRNGDRAGAGSAG